MKVLTHKEMNKRGCLYCLDYLKRKAEPTSTKKSHVCKHDQCPYHELDPFDSYAQYLKSEKPTRLKDAITEVFGIEKKLNF